jgi:hypothetical protein
MGGKINVDTPTKANVSMYRKKLLLLFFSALRGAPKHVKVKTGALYMSRQPPSTTVLVDVGPHGAS